MATIITRLPATIEEEDAAGSPIGAVVIALPISLLIWGAIIVALFNLIH